MCDIALMRRVATLVDRTSLLGATRTREVVDELARWTREELDYTVEAANAIAIRDNIRDDGHRVRPRGPPRLLDAPRAHRRAPRRHPARRHHPRAARRPRGLPAAARRGRHDLDQAAANVVWNFLGQVYATGVFHGDLHPANVLLLEGNRIGYVDFGIVGAHPAGGPAVAGRLRALAVRRRQRRRRRPAPALVAPVDQDGRRGRAHGDAAPDRAVPRGPRATPTRAGARSSRAFRSTCSQPRAGTGCRPTRSSSST